MAKAMRAEGGKVNSYTNTPNNVEEEADGKRRADGGAATTARADGGATSVSARARGGRMADEEHGETAAEEAAEEAPKKRARGGALKSVSMDGFKTKNRRLDRPGRKRGGGVGADMTPLTTAAKTTQAGDHKADGEDMTGG